MVRLVLFDIDGTLLLTNHVGITAFDRTLELMFGVQHGTRGLSFAGRTDTGLVRELFTKHKIDVTDENRRKFLDCYTHLLAEMLPHCKGVVCPGAVELMHELESLPDAPALGLLTGNFRLGAELKLLHFNLWHKFITGAFAEDNEDRNKIAHAALERGQKDLGKKLQGHEVVVIGDTPLDIACGRAIGAKVLAVATGNSPIGELAPYGCEWTVENLASIRARDICPR
jgi:phosphoglycolate phosphatase-like HAD superfamily hydrolase